MKKKPFTLGADVALALVEIASINDDVSEGWKATAKERAKNERYMATDRAEKPGY